MHGGRGWALNLKGQDRRKAAMLHPTNSTLRAFVDAKPPAGEYRLSNVSLDIVDRETAIFQATLHGPAGSHVWARAWLWNDIDNTVAEAASSRLNAGDDVVLTVKLTDDKRPDHASIRIESAPLRTEHVVGIALLLPPTTTT
jgi:hypothetical protein